jgi:hypothetical protein
MGKSAASKHRRHGSSPERRECFQRAKAEVDAMLTGLTPEAQLRLLHGEVDHSGSGMRHRDENAAGKEKEVRLFGLFPWRDQESTTDAVAQHRYILPFQKAQECAAKQHRSH